LYELDGFLTSSNIHFNFAGDLIKNEIFIGFIATNIAHGILV